jgi:hypothetical protein
MTPADAAAFEFDVIVIGAGPAGELCAGRLRDHGLTGAIVERHLVGGECSLYACMPSKALLRPTEALAEARRIPGAAEAITGQLDVGAVLRRRDEVIHNLDDSANVPWLDHRGAAVVRGHARLTGERAVEVDGNEYNIFELKESGRPVEPVYATEGSPMIVGPNGIFKNAPNPNAARLFQNYCFTAECQQLIVDVGAMRSMHPAAKEKPGRKPFREIKIMKEDAAAVEKMSEDIKARYTQIFKV